MKSYLQYIISKWSLSIADIYIWITIFVPIWYFVTMGFPCNAMQQLIMTIDNYEDTKDLDLDLEF